MDNQLVEKIVAFAVDEANITNFYDFKVPPTTVVGDGISARIGDYLKKLNSRQILIVTDKQIVSIGLMKSMIRSLERHGIRYSIFDEVEPDPTDQVVLKGIVKYKDCNCDTIVAFGGGSALDAGKAIAVFSTNPFEFNKPLTDEMVRTPRPSLLAVPTTAGTGSEVTDVSVITNTVNHLKVPLRHASFIPDIAVIDPLLTLGIPPLITAATGIDVLAHAIESFIAKGVCTLGQALSYSAMRLVGSFLPIAVGDGGNKEARHKMAVASYMAGMSFSNAGLGLCHAMAHQIGARYRVPHGMANGLVLPEVMRFNMLVRVDRLGEVARALNQRVDNLDPKDAAIKSIDSVSELIIDIGLPSRLRDVGAQEADFEEMAKQALEDPTITTNPRQASLKDIIQVFQRAY